MPREVEQEKGCGNCSYTLCEGIEPCISCDDKSKWESDEWMWNQEKLTGATSG